MRRVSATVLVAAVICLASIASPGAEQSAGKAVPTIGQFLGAASPIELVSARRADRIAWVAYDQGKRNVYTASAPAFAPVRLTAYLKDDGVELTGLRISDDGSTVVFIRGSAANRDGWNANPSGDPDGGEEVLWAAKVANPGASSSWRVGEASIAGSMRVDQRPERWRSRSERRCCSATGRPAARAPSQRPPKAPR